MSSSALTSENSAIVMIDHAVTFGMLFQGPPFGKPRWPNTDHGRKRPVNDVPASSARPQGNANHTAAQPKRTPTAPYGNTVGSTPATVNGINTEALLIAGKTAWRLASPTFEPHLQPSKNSQHTPAPPRATRTFTIKPAGAYWSHSSPLTHATRTNFPPDMSKTNTPEGLRPREPRHHQDPENPDRPRKRNSASTPRRHSVRSPTANAKPQRRPR